MGREGNMHMKSVVWLLLLCGAISIPVSAARADVLYDETDGDPDLSGIYNMPTPITLGYGSNIVKHGVNMGATLDIDLFRITLPAGGTLTDVTLIGASHPTRSFIAFQEGEEWLFDMDESHEGGDTSQCYVFCTGFAHYGDAQFGAGVGSNLLEVMNVEAASLGRPYDLPLTGSSYVFWIQELDASVVTFTYDIVVSVPGDYNEDGTVNAADYTVWRNTLGDEVAIGTGADGNRDEIVGVEDFVIWKETYGTVIDMGGGAAVDSGANVPEPSFALLTAIAGLVLGGFHRRRN
jgi:hypothetical protein